MPLTIDLDANENFNEDKVKCITNAVMLLVNNQATFNTSNQPMLVACSHYLQREMLTI